MKSFLVRLLIPCWALSCTYGSQIEQTKSKLELWVESRQILSKEHSDWIVDKDYLQQSISLLESELENLEATIQEIEAANTAASSERFTLLGERGNMQESFDVSAEYITQLEAATLELCKHFPKILLDRLERLIVRIPQDPENAKLSLGQRLQNVVGILTQAEKFDKSATYAGETRELSSGTKVQVRTLYWGLAAGFYVDIIGEKAGIGKPGAEGWVWTEHNNIAAEIKQFIDIYEGNTDLIEFVSLPVSVQ